MSLDAELAERLRDAVVDVLTDRALLDALIAAADRPLVVEADEAARLLCVSRRTVETWLTQGVLPRVPHTTRVLIPRTALEAFVAGAAPMAVSA